MKNRKGIWRIVLPLLLGGAVVAVVFYLLWGRVALGLWLLFLAVQFPLVLTLAKAGSQGSYNERAEKRHIEYLRSGDATKWLQEEQKEANAKGFAYWSAKGKNLSALNRAQAHIALGQNDEGAVLLASIAPDQLEEKDRLRWQQLMADMPGYSE